MRKRDYAEERYGVIDANASSDSGFSAVLDAASKPYRKAGRFAYYFARGKLRADPVYRAILELGLLQNHERILDLGCGQALLTALLLAAADCQEHGTWPRSWPPAPQGVSVRGIEL